MSTPHDPPWTPGEAAAAAFDLEAWLTTAGGLPPVVQAGADVLRKPAAPVAPAWFGTPALHALVEIMVDVMRRAPGVGLAAPQIGVPLRLFVAEDPEERLGQLSDESRSARGRVALPLLVLVNPTLDPIRKDPTRKAPVEQGDQITFFEGCLSVRGYGALVSRWAAVRVSGFDADGRPVSSSFEGWPARIMQHEMDHLDGTLYIDRMLTRSFASDAELPRLAAKPVDELLAELGLRET
jgi:peptide deformylase